MIPGGPRPGPDPIANARRRHERTIAWAVLGIALIGVVTAGWRSLTVEAEQGLRILVFAGVVGAAYARFLFWRGPGLPGAEWIRSTVEVSCASVVIALDMHAGPDFLVTSSTPYIYCVAIVATTLRLNPRLTVYATILAIGEHVALYTWLFTHESLHLAALPALSMQRLWQELFFRSAIFGVIGGLGALLASTLRREIAQAGEEERVRTAFGRYVDRRVVQRVLQGKLGIGPERRDITVMFVDIRGFTRMSENADPAELFPRLSSTLDGFAEEVQKQGGIVNKYLGDGLLAIFGAPEAQDDSARRAVRAALRILDAANARAADGRFPGLRVGIGIHHGAAMVGDLGGERREFTAIGDVVNVASRVEQANKELKTSILVTRPVLDRLAGDAETRAIPAVSLPGREAPVELFEVRGLARAETSATNLRPVAPPLPAT